jgi:preprotein translocase subunit SecE
MRSGSVAKAVKGKRDRAVKRAVEKSADGKRARSRGVGKGASAKPARGKAQKARAGGKGTERKGIGKFLRDVRVEMSKVTWPTRKDLIQSTIVVMVAVLIAAVYTGALDTVFSRVTDYIIRLIS